MNDISEAPVADAADNVIRLPGVEKAAVLFLCLPQDRGADLMRDLADEDIVQLTRAMTTLGKIPAATVEEVIREFCDDVSGGGVIGSIDSARRMLSGVMEDSRVADILGSGGRGNKSVWDGLSALNEKVIANYLTGERDQYVAAVLLRVKPDVAARVVPLFGEERMAKIAQKMMFMEPIEQAVLEEIEEAIQSELLSTSTRGRGTGTQQALADIFNKMDPGIFETLSGTLAVSAPDEFSAIKQKMFTFDDLARFDAATLQRIIRSCEGRTLPLALRGAGKDVRDSFLDAMTQRSRDMMQSEMDDMGQVKARDAREAQTQIIDLVNDLVRQEAIRLPSEDDEML